MNVSTVNRFGFPARRICPLRPEFYSASAIPSSSRLRQVTLVKSQRSGCGFQVKGLENTPGLAFSKGGSKQVFVSLGNDPEQDKNEVLGFLEIADRTIGLNRVFSVPEGSPASCWSSPKILIKFDLKTHKQGNLRLSISTDFQKFGAGSCNLGEAPRFVIDFPKGFNGFGLSPN